MAPLNSRRRFLRTILGTAVALAAAPLVPLVATPRPRPAAPCDISIRLIRQFEITGQVTRLDVLYGTRVLRDLAIRVLA